MGTPRRGPVRSSTGAPATTTTRPATRRTSPAGRTSRAAWSTRSSGPTTWTSGGCGWRSSAAVRPRSPSSRPWPTPVPTSRWSSGRRAGWPVWTRTTRERRGCIAGCPTGRSPRCCGRRTPRRASASTRSPTGRRGSPPHTCAAVCVRSSARRRSTSTSRRLRAVGAAPVHRPRERLPHGDRRRAGRDRHGPHRAVRTEGLELGSGERRRGGRRGHGDRAVAAGARRHGPRRRRPAGRSRRDVAYRGTMLSGVPNLAFCIGYVNASWTLRAEVTHAFVCRGARLPRRARRGVRHAGRAGRYASASDARPRLGVRGARAGPVPEAGRPGAVDDAAELVRGPPCG